MAYASKAAPRDRKEAAYAAFYGYYNVPPHCRDRQTADGVQKAKEVKASVDVQMMAYLTEEADGKAKNALFILSHEQLSALDASITDFRKAEAAHTRTVHSISAARDKAARHASVQVRLILKLARFQSGGRHLAELPCYPFLNRLCAVQC